VLSFPSFALFLWSEAVPNCFFSGSPVSISFLRTSSVVLCPSGEGIYRRCLLFALLRSLFTWRVDELPFPAYYPMHRLFLPRGSNLLFPPPTLSHHDFHAADFFLTRRRLTYGRRLLCDPPRDPLSSLKEDASFFFAIHSFFS